MDKYVIGINWEQNSSASLFCNGKCLGAISNERISRRKNDEAYPKEAIDYLLNEFCVSKAEIDCVVFVSEQWSPGWILTRHYTSFNVKDFLKEQNEIWYPNLYEGKNNSPLEIFAEKLDLDQYPGSDFWTEIIDQLTGKFAHPSNAEAIDVGKNIRRSVVVRHLGCDNVVFMDHSSCHNAYAYFSQSNRKDPFLSISLDAFGDGVNYSAKIYKPNKSAIEVIDVVKGGDFIIGRLYRYITLILGLKPNEHEYKVMGLAPYCKSKYYQNLLQEFMKIQDVIGLDFHYLEKPKDLFFSIREKLYSERFDSVAGALQAYTEYLVSNWIKNLITQTGVSKICYAGGVAMNVKTNMVISQLAEVESLYVPPCPDDTSQCIGAVYEYLSHRDMVEPIRNLHTPYLGRAADRIHAAKNESDFISNITKQLDDRTNFEFVVDDTIKTAAKALNEGKVLGVIWGREEFGARALGNRSVVANPKDPDIKIKINEMIKDRDFWMPFAASILESHASEYLDLDNHPAAYAYMTNACNSSETGKNKLRAALHPYDFTCRPHIVLEGSNHNYETLINEFGNISGTYALLNTSLNLHGSPICSIADDAIAMLNKSDLDGLLFENVLLLKKT